MYRNILQHVIDSQPLAILLVSDVTFGDPPQAIGLAYPESGISEFQVVWWGPRFQSGDDKQPRHGKLPTPDEHKSINAPAAEALIQSLNNVHVPLGNATNSVDDGAPYMLYVKKYGGSAELRWNGGGIPRGWQDLQQWFYSAWDQMRAWLELPDAHEAFKFTRPSTNA